MAGPTVISGIPELKEHVGKSLGTTRWVQVDQSKIDAFAEATGDRQWIHVDPERASRESPFKQTIAHGYWTIALAPALLPELLRVERASLVVNYGIDKLRLPAPVPSGSRLRMSAQIKHVREIKGGGARVMIALNFEVEGSAKPACAADAIYVYFP